MDMLNTFYGKDYSDYLYLETDSDGKIVCYGSVSPGFETNKYSYGEKLILMLGQVVRRKTMMASYML